MSVPVESHKDYRLVFNGKEYEQPLTVIAQEPNADFSDILQTGQQFVYVAEPPTVDPRSTSSETLGLQLVGRTGAVVTDRDYLAFGGGFPGQIFVLSFLETRWKNNSKTFKRFSRP